MDRKRYCTAEFPIVGTNCLYRILVGPGKLSYRVFRNNLRASNKMTLARRVDADSPSRRSRGSGKHASRLRSGLRVQTQMRPVRAARRRDNARIILLDALTETNTSIRHWQRNG